MSKKSKREERMRNNPVGVSFDDLRSVMENHGFELEHGQGSHNVFKHKETKKSLTIPKSGNDVKPVYVKQAMAAIDELEDEDD